MTDAPQAATERRFQNFSNDESFGLFMEAIRALHFYEDESTKRNPNPELLNGHLAEALELLETCHRFYPDDILPNYYLGIALTMENQRLYAELLRDDRTKRISGMILRKGDPTGTGRGPLPSQPWPLLSRALNCFYHGARMKELKTAAEFNQANVYARRGQPKDYRDALKILDSLSPASLKAGESRRARWFDSFLVDSAQQKRESNERTAFNLSVRILHAATLALRTIDVTTRSKKTRESKKRVDADKSQELKKRLDAVIKELTKCRDDAGDTLEDSARHDVLSDALTKRGMVKYFYEVAQDAWDEERLMEAEADFKEALQHKPNWIPARTYLAQVYQALGKEDQAEVQLTAILGKSPQKEASLAALQAEAKQNLEAPPEESGRYFREDNQ